MKLLISLNCFLLSSCHNFMGPLNLSLGYSSMPILDFFKYSEVYILKYNAHAVVYVGYVLTCYVKLCSPDYLTLYLIMLVLFTYSFLLYWFSVYYTSLFWYCLSVFAPGCETGLQFIGTVCQTHLASCTSLDARSLHTLVT